MAVIRGINIGAYRWPTVLENTASNLIPVVLSNLDSLPRQLLETPGKQVLLIQPSFYSING